MVDFRTLSEKEADSERAAARIPGDPPAQSSRAALKEQKGAFAAWAQHNHRTPTLLEAILDRVNECNDLEELEKVISFFKIEGQH